MRVITGKAKGLRLRVLAPVRPTTDVVRGALFSMLAALNGGQRRVLDLYAGSGALGIEALSRGAEWADFVEREPKNCAIIKQNLEQTGLSTQAHVYCTSAKKALSFLKQDYDLILLDPPYSFSSLPFLLNEVASSAVARGALLAVCHSSRVTLNIGSGLKLLRSRRHGDTSISIFKVENQA